MALPPFGREVAGTQSFLQFPRGQDYLARIQLPSINCHRGQSLDGKTQDIVDSCVENRGRKAVSNRAGPKSGEALKVGSGWDRRVRYREMGKDRKMRERWGDE